MKLSLVERETILLYNQAEPMAEVYTHDPRLMEKLELLAKKHPDQITRKDAHNFTVPKRCVSLREPYSAERRKAASERAKAAGYQPPVRKSRTMGDETQCPASWLFGMNGSVFLVFAFGFVWKHHFKFTRR